jgi:hypothetical protein
MAKAAKSAFIEALCKTLGVDPSLTYRIVIDIQGHAGVTVHIEQRGDDKLLNVIRTLDGVDITRVEKGEG